MQDLSHLSIDAATACLLSPKRTRVRLALIRHLNKCVGFMQDLSQLSLRAAVGCEQAAEMPQRPTVTQTCLLWLP